MTIMFFCLSCSWKDVFLCYITCYILMIIIQFPYILLNQFVLHISDYDILSLFGILYSLVVAILLKHFCPLHKLYHTLFQRTGIWTFFLANLFACSLIITFFYKIDRRSFEQMSMFFLFSFMILLYMNIVLFNQFKRIRHQEKQLAAYDEYMPMVEQLITQVRARQHHHTNEIQSIISLMYTHKDYDSLTSAIRCQTSTMTALPSIMAGTICGKAGPMPMRNAQTGESSATASPPHRPHSSPEAIRIRLTSEPVTYWPIERVTNCTATSSARKIAVRHSVFSLELVLGLLIVVSFW